jgi:1-deoxy-D-xylulose-5-phosphate synthase
LLKSGNQTAVLSTGFIGKNVTLAFEKISNATAAHYDFGFVKPLDENLLHEIFTFFETIITLEDGAVKGGFGSAIIEFAAQNMYTNKIQTLGVPDSFIEHGTIEELQKICGIDVDALVRILS